MVDVKPKMSLADASTLPVRTSTKTEQWIQYLTQIPTGRMWKFSEDFGDIKPATIKQAVKRLVKANKVATDLIVKQHNKGTKDKPLYELFILHKPTK